MVQKIITNIYDDRRGFLGKYREICVGNKGLAFLAYYELVTLLFGHLPGAMGLFFRAKAYRPLFRKIGKGVVFGVGTVIRNPNGITIGDSVIVDDGCVLDAKGGGEIEIGSRVFLSRNVILACKGGRIRLGNEVSVGPNAIVHSLEDTPVRVGDYCVVAPYCYLVGGADYRTERTDTPMALQGLEVGQGITVGRDVWLGARVTVLDGASIGDGAVVAAQALVRGEIPALAVCAGVPAIVKKFRGGEDPDEDGEIQST